MTSLRTLICRILAYPLFGALFVAATGPSLADDPQPLVTPVDQLITEETIAEIKEWATAPIVIEALMSQSPVEQDVIDALDQQWRQERELDDQPLITSVLASPLSTYLIRLQARSVGKYTEIFIMNRNGLNAGQSGITSDFWQGDEAKFQQTADISPDAVFIDEPEYHADTATWRVQVNMSIADDQNNTLGAITAELNLTELERRLAAGLNF
ncbi:MAG: hypothetical protein RIM33_14355 [Alphaproteobacteria bacterium]